MTADDELSEREAADELGVAPERLRRWRHQGDAPPHHTDDSEGVYYRRRDLVEWREHYVYPPGDVDHDEGAA